MDRFTGVEWDNESKITARFAYNLYSQIERFMEENILDGRSKSLALTHLEESFMWLGKAIANEQRTREK